MRDMSAPIVRYGILLLILLCCRIASAQGSAPVESSQLLKEAIQILGGSQNLSVRWQSDIRYLLVQSDPSGLISPQITRSGLNHSESNYSRAEKITEDLFAELSLLSGIQIKAIENPYTDVGDYLDGLKRSPPYLSVNCEHFRPKVCPNFIIVRTTQQHMHTIATAIPLRPVFQRATAGDDPVLCFFSPGVKPNRVIVSGFVFVDVMLDTAMLRTCLQEELFQSFGLFNDFTRAQYFSFDNNTEPKNLTRYDRSLISSLYHEYHPVGTRVGKIARHMLAKEISVSNDLLAEIP